MKKCFLFIFYALLALQSFAQTGNWQWGKGTNGTGLQEGVAVTSDVSGNIYVTGFFTGDSITFGDITLYSSCSQNIFIAKYTPSGRALWAKAATGYNAATVQGTGIATDASGNVCVTGYYSGNAVSFDYIALPSTGVYSFNPFIAKYDSSGNVLWLKSATSQYNGQCQSQGIASDTAGSFYITGWFQTGNIMFDNFTLNNIAGSQKLFLVKYNSAGYVVWAKAVGGQNDEVFGIASDRNSNIFITGIFGTSITFDAITLNDGTHNGGGAPDYFIAKYDSSGNALWAKGETGCGQCGGRAVATDATGNVYVTGFIEQYSSDFGGVTFPITQSPFICFLAKYNSAGNILWGKSSGGTAQATGYALATDANAHVYLGGGFTGDTINFGVNTQIVPFSASDPLFLYTFDSTGNVLCGTALQSGADDEFGICTDRNGNVYIGSDFEMNPFVVGADTLHLTDTTEVDDTLEIEETENIYVARYYCPTCVANALNYQLTSASICAGGLDTIILGGDSAYTISPANFVTWQNTTRATLSPDTTMMFTITGYNSCGANQVTTFTLPVLSPRYIPITTTKASLCPGDNAQICVPAGFSYMWSTGATTACITTDSAGAYSVTASNNGLCFASNNQAIVAYTTQPFNVNVHGDTLSYSNSTNYQWLLNGNPIAGATSSTYIAGNGGAYTLQITDTNGCPVISNPVIISGINNLSDYFISIYPNPSTGTWELQVDNRLLGADAEVFDATGKLVFKSVITNQNSTIDLPGVAGGTYQLRITLHGNSVVRKLVKM